MTKYKAIESITENLARLKEIVTKEIHSCISLSQANSLISEIETQLVEADKHVDYLERMNDMHSRSGPLDD